MSDTEPTRDELRARKFVIVSLRGATLHPCGPFESKEAAETYNAELYVRGSVVALEEPVAASDSKEKP